VVENGEQPLQTGNAAGKDLADRFADSRLRDDVRGEGGGGGEDVRHFVFFLFRTGTFAGHT
jgi:hypothetical protein